MSYTLFYMWERYRQHLMVEHCFYVEQAKKRLLSQFTDIESESELAAKNHLVTMSEHFDPDNHDLSDFYDAARNEGIAFYSQLSDMHERTQFSVAAGMYHEWDKKLREWLTKEIKHWHAGDNLPKVLWKISFKEIMDFLTSMGWPVTNKTYYPKLYALHLIVNVFKHGRGNSFTTLKKRYPDYFKNRFAELMAWGGDHLDYADLKITDKQIDEFSEAIIAFWKDVPERIFDDDSLCVTSWPKKLKEAWEEDSSQVKSSQTTSSSLQPISRKRDKGARTSRERKTA